jgi:hypothetical protein
VLVAGVDVGNSTTELAVARVEPGYEPEFLLVLRRETTGPKASAACAEGVADLVDRAERRLGERAHRLLLAELHPVETDLVELGRLEELELGRAAVARPASATPSGAGVGAGILVSLEQLTGTAAAEAVIPVVTSQDFEEAAGGLRNARDCGWTIAAAIVQGDDAVLIGNRFDRALPIVDEVTDAGDLPLGSRSAVEVAPPGGTVTSLSDPLRLAVLLDLTPDEARGARIAARAVAGHRAALVVRNPTRPAPELTREQPLELLGADGHAWPLDERGEVPPPGAIAALRGPLGDRGGLLDVFWQPLPVPPDDPGFARRLAHRRATAIALVAKGSADDLLDGLSRLAPEGARVVARESDAALLGASTTPGAGTAPFVVDLGGGTVDLHRDGAACTTAGAGELVTRICAALLGCRRETAERAKRRASARVETPFMLHHEDGTRTFVGEPAPPRTLGRLCVVEPHDLVPLDAPLAPEVWRLLRRAAKRNVLARNVRRAIDAVGGVPRGELVTLVGGSACDPEVADAVAAELVDLDVAVARGNVLGRHGPRGAVAVGLVLAGAR